MAQTSKALGSHIFLGIPTLSTARRSTAWMDGLYSLQMPLGTSLARAWAEDLPIAAARNRLCQAGIDAGADYILFLSDDVIPPPNMVLAMLDKIGREYPVENGNVARASMVSGVYWTKTTPSEPYLWNGLLKGSYKDWRVGEFFPIDFAGCDALMIETAALKECPQPWFSTEWIWEEGQEVSPIATEDFYFYTKMRKAGFRLFVDTSIQARHEDRHTGVQYGLTVDMPQAMDERPESEFRGQYIADIGAGYDTPRFEGAKVVRFDGDQAVRPDVRCDIRAIPDLYKGKFDVVHTRHVLEHFARREAPSIVAHWASLLVPDGELVIRVPNIEWAIERFVDPEASTAQRAYAWDQLYGAQKGPYDFHKNGFTERKLTSLLQLTGILTDVEVTLEDEGQNLCAKARYTGPPVITRLVEEWDEIREQEGLGTPSTAPVEGVSSPGTGEGVASPVASTEHSYLGRLCDIKDCNRPAESLARDLFNDAPSPGDPAMWVPSQYDKAGCVDHPVYSVKYSKRGL